MAWFFVLERSAALSLLGKMVPHRSSRGYSQAWGGAGGDLIRAAGTGIRSLCGSADVTSCHLFCPESGGRRGQ